jgi:archaellum component FlaC
MSDELKIVLEDVDEKFDTVIEAFNLVRENLDRSRDENKQEHEELRKDILDLKVEVSYIRQDFNDHRTNTELHTVKGKGHVG